VKFALSAGWKSERAEFAPLLLVSDLTYSQLKTVPDKALTIAGADRFTRRGDTCRLHTIFMNQLCLNWGYQEDLSSTAAFRPILDRQSGHAHRQWEKR
jgi:hypothetical protein